MVYYMDHFHNMQRCFGFDSSIRSEHTISLTLSCWNLSFPKLPLFEMTEFTNRDAFLIKGMIGGNTNNGKGDTYF